jgi:hypothetical protein
MTSQHSMVTLMRDRAGLIIIMSESTPTGVL